MTHNNTFFVIFRAEQDHLNKHSSFFFFFFLSVERRLCKHMCLWHLMTTSNVMLLFLRCGCGLLVIRSDAIKSEVSCWCFTEKKMSLFVSFSWMRWGRARSFSAVGDAIRLLRFFDFSIFWLTQWETCSWAEEKWPFPLFEFLSSTEETATMIDGLEAVDKPIFNDFSSPKRFQSLSQL